MLPLRVTSQPTAYTHTFDYVLHSYGHVHGDFLVRRISNYLEVGEGEAVNVLDVRIDVQSWERTWLTRQLLLQRFNVVQVHVGVTHVLITRTNAQPMSASV